MIKITQNQLKQIIREELALLEDPAEEEVGPFTKSLAKGLAYMAYPFVKAKRAVASIDHFETLELDDYVVNHDYNRAGFEGKQIVPTKIKVAAIDSNGNIQKIFYLPIEVLPYSRDNSIGGNLEIQTYDVERTLSTGDALELMSFARKTEKAINKLFMKDMQKKKTKHQKQG